MPRTRLPALLLLATLATLPWAAACAGGSDRTCSADADCASGRCLPEGLCAPAEGADAGAAPDGGGPGDAAAGQDAGATPDGGGPADAALPGCSPNRDGRIDRLEVPLAAGLRATFRVATDATVSTAGEDLGGGRRRWDLSSALAGDHDVLVETQPVEDRWFAGDFPTASYATRLDDRDDFLGVFEIDATSLSLLGVVSPADGATRTRLTHDPPATVLAFPLERGGSWTTTATVSGTTRGVPSVWTERYQSSVDAAGELLTPFGTFEVLRVRIVLTRTVGALVTVVRTFAFVSECFGTVATITSGDNEAREEFTRAAEARRLAP